VGTTLSRFPFFFFLLDDNNTNNNNINYFAPSRFDLSSSDPSDRSILSVDLAVIFLDYYAVVGGRLMGKGLMDEILHSLLNRSDIVCWMKRYPLPVSDGASIFVSGKHS
jgi:hypothetical protein